ncbi:hypothetical protein A5886_001638 [Enterococcus sp. 8G7_MSG3316]|uniref:P-type ATPase A domain-containing protein n=1 Tax=Candidatus Enterococcus testudinis TaxID=1834191 RepID=A0A242A753_9ENTE|nr:heavy metal translocating P-type ATPase [Enterococcus sp. 8G7_MSG3316]OTN76561.1 hypothetical protein A5886_001638 [Enterococcus sp. 8G7_MSG3316]
MSEHTCHQAQTHNDHHSHNHSHLSVKWFFVGFICFMAALIIPTDSIKTVLYLLTILFAGYHIIGEGITDTISQTKSNHRFTPNVHLLMTAATLGSVVIGNYSEGALLILIFAGAHFLEEYAEGQSRREITNLLKINPTEARLIDANGIVTKIAAETVKQGDHLQVLPGDQVAADGVIISGSSDINEASINGESVPREKTVGDEVFGSTMNGSGNFTMEVTKDSADSVFAKIIAMAAQAQSNMSPTETTIKKIEPMYVKIVFLLVPLFILTAPFLLGWDWSTSFYRGMVMMIAASPCALAASAVPVSLSALSNLAKRGVLFKGSTFLTQFAHINVIAFDKTGTLTKGKPTVTEVVYGTADRTSIDAVITAMEKQANHPLAEAIIAHFDRSELPTQHLTVTNQAGTGLIANQGDQQYRLGKVSPDLDIAATLKSAIDDLEAKGRTIVLFSINQSVEAVIGLMDQPNDKAYAVIERMKKQGIQTVMITGDRQAAGDTIGAQLQIDQTIAQVMPADKAAIVADLQRKYGVTAMVGDGINDAPALVQADIGIAMGEGSDAAIEVADAVLMKNDLYRVDYAYRIAKKTEKVMWQNIYFSMLIVALLVVLNLLGKMNIGLGVIAHEGSTLLVLLNGLRLLKKLPE